MECFAQWDTAVFPQKESSDDNLNLMEMLLNVYLGKFGISYLDDFMNEQDAKEDKRFSERKNNAKNQGEFNYILKDHENNQKQLESLKCRILAKYDTKKV